MGGDQCRLSLAALCISSNNPRRVHHLAHRFPVQDSQTPSGKKSPSHSISATVTHKEGGGSAGEEDELRGKKYLWQAKSR